MNAEINEIMEDAGWTGFAAALPAPSKTLSPSALLSAGKVSGVTGSPRQAMNRATCSPLIFTMTGLIGVREAAGLYIASNSAVESTFQSLTLLLAT